VGTKLCVLSCLHDDYWFVERSLSACKAAGPILAVVSRKAWNGTPGDWERTAAEAEKAGAEVILGDWTEEADQRRFALEEARRRGFTHAIIPDGDEVLEPQLLKTLVKLAKAEVAERVYVHMDTYWKSARYVIRPRERLTPVILLDLRAVEHVYIRDYQGGRPLFLGPEHGVLHHLSYAGPDERIRRKLDTWSHRHEVLEDWYRRIWLAWDRDPLMRNLHPTHPQAYGFAERIEIPEVLQGAWDERQVAQDPPRPKQWPTVSIVIPLHGGEEDIRNCLSSLDRCKDLLHETIVVNDVSPDEAAAVAREFEGVKVLHNSKNLGFGRTCNRGYRESTGEVVIFLNSDTQVPRAGLVRLVESLMSSGTVGATGPYTNNAGYHQPIDPTFTDIQNLDLFATDFAAREAEDLDVPILVGFCLAVRRSVLEEVGVFDELFGRGLFEDNDLVYRIQRAGYKIRIATRSYVHHEGSKSLARIGEPPEVLLARNMDLYHAKWRSEIESGFASHLPGQKAEPIVFRPELHPDAVRARCQKLAREADISLCMIVRDEERVIRECLESAKPFFSQIIVVDTGSKDRTPEIAAEIGAEVHKIQWPDSFAEARNESLKYAKGRWIFWLDADDTLPPSSGEAILKTALTAPSEVAGFIVPVQFVEEGPGAGTRVDHVKLFRNLPGLGFEGRIHEQILGALRPHGAIARIPGAVVMHTGYDTSAEGQKKKRARDEVLLNLDLAERPNHPFVLFNFGMTAHFCGDHPAAIEWFDKCLAVSKPEESHVRKTYALLGCSIREMGDPEGALATFRKGIEVVEGDPELTFQCGLTLTLLGRFAEAKTEYLSIDPDISGFFSSLDIGILGFKRFGNLGRVCMAMGDYPEAREYLLQAFEMNPRAHDIAVDLVRAALERDDLRTAQETLDKFKEYAGPVEAWADLQAKLMERRGESPDEFLWLTARRSPTAVGPRLVLARRMLHSGYENEAAPHLEILEGLGCAEAAYFRGVCATRRGDFQQAIVHMRHAYELDPKHEQTLEQISALERAIAEG